ncbi:MAG: hypothetical protein JXA21_29920 [Anaerolineae bacterium]|nr:hypothetical protein [Anaerolineae bacterium]
MNIELAPTHKYGLSLPTPVMPAAGTLGFGDLCRDVLESGALGALVTNPLSLRPRRAAQGQRLAVRGEHFIAHTGLPNAGIRDTIRQYSKYWERLSIPVIPHLIATTPSETGKAATQLSAAPNVGGVELGLAENTPLEKALALLAATKGGSGLPILVQVPFSQVETLAPALAEAGADALVLTAPPRAILPVAGSHPDARYFTRGRLYGPAVFPLLLNVLAQWTAPGVNRLRIPVIACGGITSTEDALACISLGATAVQIDALAWRDPGLFARISEGLKAYFTEKETKGT